MSKLIRDTRLLFGRSLKSTLRNPIWIIMGLMQPILYLLLFAPLLDGLTGPGMGEGAALKVFTPGLLIMTALYSASFVGFGIIADLRAGVVERLRVTPVSRLAIMLGLVLRDVLMLIVQCVLLVLAATLMGLRADALGLLILFGLMTLIGVLMASISYALGLSLKNEDALASTLNSFMLPLTLLSGIMLPLTLAPQLLRTIASLNPFAHAVEAARALVNGDLTNGAIGEGFVFIAALAVLALWWAARVFRSATA